MIRIRTLGGLSAQRDDTAAAGTPIQPRRLAVLALVARAGDRGVTREHLLAMLWPDADEVGGRRSLSQALHALRADLHDDLFVGMQELRLNEAVAHCDVSEFETAVAAQEWDRAAAIYGGPFLKGFRLAGAREFERWAEEERNHLAHRQAEVLERLARMATERGDKAGAVNWWRRRAALDTLNARVTLELMRALAALGERHAALQQARIYEALLEQELALAPDAEVVRYAEELRRTLPVASSSPEAATPAVLPDSSLPPVSPVPAEPVVTVSVPSIRPTRRIGTRPALTALIVVAAIALGVALWIRRIPRPVPVLAVGAIADYRGTAGTAPLTDMLATNLARIPGLQVTSTARLLELIERAGKPPDAAAFAAAARQAGASELIEGGLHEVPGGMLLALRRVDLATGSVRGAWRLEGKDYFTLVDRVTAELAATLGFATESLGPGGLTSSSLVAWRFYEEGLRRWAQGDYHGAEGLFQAALREDSTFAMAAYHGLRARQALDILPDSAQLAWLTRLAQRTNDRDRLQILGWVAFMVQSPALPAIADTLIIRYPTDIESQYLAGFTRMARADFSAALPYLHRVIDADSASLGKATGRCLACDALSLLIYAYLALDSIPRAQQVALTWTRRDPQSSRAWGSLSAILSVLGRPDEAIVARRKATSQDAYENVFPGIVRLRAGDFPAADQVARAQLAEGADHESTWQGFWLLTISLRYQARWRELNEVADRRLASATEADRIGEHGRRLRLTVALTLLEAGRAADAIRILDSLTRWVDPRLPVSALGGRPLMFTVLYTMLAEAALAAGDAPLVSLAADSTEAWARRSGKIREMGFATHARALTQLAQHDTVGAMRTFERAIYSLTLGFTRSNYHLARLLLLRGEPRKAADLLRPALQGSVEGQNYFVTFTEIHELLAQAYGRLGKADSARAHWSWVAAALAHSDSAARPRYVAAMNQLGNSKSESPPR